MSEERDICIFSTSTSHLRPAEWIDVKNVRISTFAKTLLLLRRCAQVITFFIWQVSGRCVACNIRDIV